MRKLAGAHNSEITSVIVRQDATGTKFLTGGLDGFIKLNDLEPQTLKCNFISKSGITTACQLSSPDTLALATLTNDINLFNFATGNSM
jgi:WD40 repeat protein